MRLKSLVPGPIRELLRRPYHYVRETPTRLREAALKTEARKRFEADGRGVTVRVTDDFQPKIHFNSYDVFREYETHPEMRQEIRQFLAFLRSLDGPTRFIDVGAHYGLFSLAAIHAGKPGSKVLALEPSPPAFTELCRNLELLGSDSIVPIQAAVGEETSELVMHVTHDGRGMMVAVKQEEKYEYESVKVPVVTLDDLCDERSFAPNVLKIDVEGFEGEVLRGARRVLREDRPAIFLEVHGFLLKRRGLDSQVAFGPVREAGYTIEAVDGDTAEAMAAVDADGAVRRFFCESRSST